MLSNLHVKHMLDTCITELASRNTIFEIEFISPTDMLKTACGTLSVGRSYTIQKPLVAYDWSILDRTQTAILWLPIKERFRAYNILNTTVLVCTSTSIS